MKWGKILALGAFFLALSATFACRRYVRYRTPRLIVERIRTPRCVGKLYTYPCRHPDGHLKREVIRCRRFGRWVIRRRRWIERDPRCGGDHAYIDDNGPPPAEPTPPPPDDAP